MADETIPLTESEGARTIYGQELTWKKQGRNDGSAGELVGDNGDPNADPNWAPDADPATFIGVDISRTRNAVFEIHPPADTVMKLELWYNWHGRPGWAFVDGSAQKFGAVDKVTTDELRVRGVDFVYFRRVDGLGGEWAAYVGELG